MNYRVSICDIHFDPGDILVRGSKRSLRIGAVPIHNLPKVRGYVPASRKSPIMREDPLPKKRHRSHDDSWNSIRNLSIPAKGLFKMSE